MSMIDIQRVKTLMYKDLTEVRMDKGIWLPLLLIPFLFGFVIPLLAVVTGTNPELASLVNGAELFIESFPVQLVPAGIQDTQLFTYAFLMYFTVPFFLLIPIIISTTLSVTSFIGEKENKTLEGLFYTPLTTQELMLGKILASALPSVLITWIAAIVYGIIVNIFGMQVIGQLIFPNINWLIVLFLLVPLITFLSISLILFVSHRVKTSKSAQSVSMLLVFPVIGFVVSQSAGVLLFNPLFGFVLSGILLIIDGICFYFLTKLFNRGKYLTSI